MKVGGAVFASSMRSRSSTVRKSWPLGAIALANCCSRVDQRVVLHDDVGRDAAAAVDDAAGVRLVRRDASSCVAFVSFVSGGVFDELTVHELARTLNRAAARREPLARRDLERVAAVELVDALHESLAEARLSDDERAIVILQRAGDDLGRRRGALVRQDDDRNGRRDRRRLGACNSPTRPSRPFTDGDLLSLLQEHVRDLEALVEDAARIAAHVEDDAARALRLELLDGGRDVVGRVLVELLERDVPDLVAER